MFELKKVFDCQKMPDEIRDALYEEVKSLGGLFVLGTERHEARRIDNQLRGRSGRQWKVHSVSQAVSKEERGSLKGTIAVGDPEDLPAVGVGRIHGALRVDDDAVDPVELAGAEALLAPRRDHLAVFQRQLVHAFQRMVGNERKPIVALA